jgi:hypothetical protein
MAISSIDDSQRTAARVAGFAYLFTLATVVFAQFGIHSRLINDKSGAEAVRNIVASERLFRISIACELVYCAGGVVLLAALYMILKPVNKNLALLAVFWKLVYVLMWVLMMLNLFTALRLSRGATYLQAFEAERLQALVRLTIGERFDEYYVGLMFYALGSTVCGYLWFKSRYIPRVLAAGGLFSSMWCAACTFAFIIFPNFTKAVNLWWFDTPMSIFDIATGFWLLFRGLRPSGTAEPDKARDRAQAGAESIVDFVQ